MGVSPSYPANRAFAQAGQGRAPARRQGSLDGPKLTNGLPGLSRAKLLLFQI